MFCVKEFQKLFWSNLSCFVKAKASGISARFSLIYGKKKNKKTKKKEPLFIFHAFNKCL